MDNVFVDSGHLFPPTNTNILGRHYDLKLPIGKILRLTQQRSRRHKQERRIGREGRPGSPSRYFPCRGLICYQSDACRPKWSSNLVLSSHRCYLTVTDNFSFHFPQYISSCSVDTCGRVRLPSQEKYAVKETQFF